MNEIEFVNGRRVLPAGFDVEKAERAIDFFLNASTSSRTYITFSTLTGRYLMRYVTLYSGSTSRWRLCELLGVDPWDRATLRNWNKRRAAAGE